MTGLHRVRVRVRVPEGLRLWMGVWGSDKRDRLIEGIDGKGKRSIIVYMNTLR